MGEIKQKSFYLYLFSGTHLQVRPDNRFSRLMAQTMRTRARVCLLGVSLTLFPILGVKSPENPNFWGVGVFKPNGQNIESFMLSKLLHRFQPNSAQRYRPPSGHRGWSKYVPNKSKMADDRHFAKPVKSPYLQYFDRF